VAAVQSDRRTIERAVSASHGAAKTLLATTHLGIADVAQRCGFEDQTLSA
jgi:transcriptional regulator GlxA family with amidase domain